MSDGRAIPTRGANQDATGTNAATHAEKYEAWEGEWEDDPRKPWTVSCDCGYVSFHTTWSAGHKALLKHQREADNA